MTPEQRQKMREKRQQRWKNMTPEQRQQQKRHLKQRQ
jgi:hypothetical protein